MKNLQKGAVLAVAAAGLLLTGCASHAANCGGDAAPVVVKHACKGAASCKSRVRHHRHHAAKAKAAAAAAAASTDATGAAQEGKA